MRGQLFQSPILLIILLSLFFAGHTAAQKTQPLTIVEGYVIDASKGDTIPFANISVVGTTTGVSADENGYFKCAFSEQRDSIQVSAVGYKTFFQLVEKNTTQHIDIHLINTSTELQTVVVHQQRYRNRGNPAVELIQKVIDHKSSNRLESHDFYQYEQYEKMDLALANVPDAMKKSRLLKNVNFFFADVDTSSLKGKELIPAYQRETVSDVYFRKSPETQTAFVRGTKHTDWTGAFDDDGVATYLKRLYIDANIYNNEIELFKKPFLSPLSPLAPQLYRFYIMDTAMVDGQRCINLAFFPRSKADLTFEGNLYITDDTTYAIRKVTMTIPKDININFVNGLQITQNFDKLPNVGWTLVRDEVSINFAGGNDSTKTVGVFGKKTSIRRQFVFDKASEPQMYHREQAVIKTANAEKQSDSFWATARQEPLSKTEQNTYAKIDSLTQTTDYKRFVGFKYLWATGYWLSKGVEFGPFGALYSHNALEGGRIRLGARTTYDLNHHWRAYGYGAYGLLDKKWKYSAAITYQLNDNFFNNRPQNAFRIWSLNDVEVPGQTLENTAPDNILTSFNRGKFDKMYYKRAFGISYINESNVGKMYQIGLQQRQLTPAGSLSFVGKDLDGAPHTAARLLTNEAFVNLRYAPNEEFFQGQTYRKRIVNKYPVFGLHYTYGLGNDGTNNFNYHNVSADVFKRFYIAPIGRMDVRFEMGRVFGSNLSYPLLHVFQANQTGNYEQFAFNQMNYLEFISDKYAFLNVEHAFDGFFLNKIPLIKKLKWREFTMFKAVYGGLDAANNPATNPSVFSFPTDANGQSLTYSFNKQPYMEAGFGIGNIFKVFRVDVTRRLNYLDNPNTSKWRVQGEIQFDF